MSGSVRGGGGGEAAEGEFSEAKTSVWWDIENCAVPRGCDPHTIAKNIGIALADMGYKGAVSNISAYGDTNKITTSVQHALHSTGVTLNHIPAGVKDASDKKILVDMLFWAIDNPPPANYVLISGDRDFSNALHQLRMRRYNILLAHAPNVSQALVAAAKYAWLWTSFLSGGPPLSNESTPSSSSSFSNAETSGVFNSENYQHVDPSKKSQPVGSSQGNYTPKKFQNTRGNHKQERWPYNSEKKHHVDPSKKAQFVGSTQGNFKPDKQPSNSEKKPHVDPSKNSQTVASAQETGKPNKSSKGKQNWNPTNNMNPPAIWTSNMEHAEKFENSKPFPPPSNQGSTFSSTSSTPLESMQAKGTLPVSSVPPTLSRTPSNLSTESDYVREAPHKFFGTVDCSEGTMTSLSSTPNGPSNYQICPPQGTMTSFSSTPSGPSNYQIRPPQSTMTSLSSTPSGPSNYQMYPPQLLRPSDFRPQPPIMPGSLQEAWTSSNAESYFQHNSSGSQPSNFGSHFTSSPGMNLPDLNRINISGHPHGGNNYDLPYRSNQGPPLQPRVVTSFPQRTEFSTSPIPTIDGGTFVDGGWRMPVPALPSEEAQFHIGNILRALHILKTDRMAPTEENIADCIHYGWEINILKFNVGLGIDHAIRFNMIEKRTLGTSLQYYIGKNDKLWPCVNVMDSPKHPKSVWKVIQGYLTSSSGRSAILATKCRYQAAIILRENCFKGRVLGEVLQILNMLINYKKWLVLPHPSAWQPLSINLPVPSEAQTGVVS